MQINKSSYNKLENYSSISKSNYFVVWCIAVATGDEALTTSIFNMVMHTSIGPVQIRRCLFDSGALCRYSLIASKVLNQLAHKGIHLTVEPVDVNISPFAGAAVAAEGKISVTMSVQDVMNITHYATFECLVVPFNSFDIIINNDTCRIKFARFFYNPDNFVVLINPFKPHPCEEELHDVYPDPYGQVQAVMAMLETEFSDFEDVLAITVDLRKQLAILVLALAEFGLNEETRQQLELFLTSKHHIFTLDNIGINNVLVDITTASNLPQEIIAKPRVVRRDLLPLVEKELKQYTELRLHQLCESPYSAPIVPVKKPDGTVRIAIDYSVGINKYITMPSIQIPVIRDILRNLSRFSYFFEIDLSKAYRQLKLTDRSSMLLAYVTHIGQFRPITLPEGVRTAPQIFSQVMYQLLRTPYKFGNEVEYYFDKIYGGAQ